jgi:hypothetical protein
MLATSATVKDALSLASLVLIGFEISGTDSRISRWAGERVKCSRG